MARKLLFLLLIAAMVSAFAGISTFYPAKAQEVAAPGLSEGETKIIRLKKVGGDIYRIESRNPDVIAVRFEGGTVDLPIFISVIGPVAKLDIPASESSTPFLIMGSDELVPTKPLTVLHDPPGLEDIDENGIAHMQVGQFTSDWAVFFQDLGLVEDYSQGYKWALELYKKGELPLPNQALILSRFTATNEQESNAKSTELEKEVKEIKEATDQLQFNLNELEKKINRSQKILESVDEQKNQITESILKKIEDRNEKTKTRIDEISRKNEDLTDAINNLDNKLTETESKLQKVQKQNEEVLNNLQKTIPEKGKQSEMQIPGYVLVIFILLFLTGLFLLSVIAFLLLILTLGIGFWAFIQRGFSSEARNGEREPDEIKEVRMVYEKREIPEEPEE